MKFTTEWPKESGYYWFVDTDYPMPVIGFLQGEFLYAERTYTRAHCRPGRPGIRIGDRIEAPACTDCKVQP